MTLAPVGKWYAIALDPVTGVVILPMGTEEKPQTGTVLAAGDLCKAKPGDRILFQKNTIQEASVDGTKVVLLHEDHLLAILDDEARKDKRRYCMDHGLADLCWQGGTLPLEKAVDRTNIGPPPRRVNPA